MHTKNCPKCNTEWEEKENIYETFIRQGKTKEESSIAAEMYGCTKENPQYFGKDVIGIETDKYDGVSYWECQQCKTVFDRFTMKELTLKKVA